VFAGHYQHIVDKLTKTHILNLHVQTKSDSADLAALHYANNRRIAPIVVFAEPGWVIKTSKTVMNQSTFGFSPYFIVLFFILSCLVTLLDIH
jgi:hypothetical protein